MHLLRRSIAFVILLAAIYVGYEAHATDLGLGGLVYFVIAIVVGFFALVVAFFDPPINSEGWHKEMRYERSMLSGKHEAIFAAVAIFLFGAALIYLALLGIHRGTMPAPWSRPDISFAQEPLLYLFALTVWLGAGGGLVWLSTKHHKFRSQPEARDDT
jgi:hypothetical protein